jgi:hypothetical protein
MKNSTALSLVILAALLLTGCADNPEVKCEAIAGHQYGFWGGLWHGLIVGFDFIGSLIWDDVAVYAPNNNGGWYAFGFTLGVGGFSSITSAFRNVRTQED